jgi:TRAP-type C4-dicarboxylate transport system substrate-binding protein
MRRQWVLAAVTGGFMVAIVGAVGAADYPKTQFKFGHILPPTSGPALADGWFAEELSKRSGGKVTQQMFWASSAGKPAELLELTGQGAVDVATVVTSYFPAQLPLLSAISAIPFAFPTTESAQKVAHKLWQEFPAMQDEARKNKIWPLWFHVLNQYHLLCRTPVKALADLKDKKIRSQGEYMPMALNAVGAVPVTILPGEFYESMQRGSVDCMLLPWDLLNANRLYEVAKFGSTISFGTVISHAVAYNLDTWNNLPDGVKQLLHAVAEDAKKYDLEKAAEAEAKALENMKKNGVEIIPFESQKEFEAALPDFFAIWTERMEKLGQGPAAKAIVARWKEIR